uniref:Uncharacterized protein n=1 Tax=Anguilla anguilla TaxID=7936 RepID=A0A0E9TDC3_ANGAN
MDSTRCWKHSVRILAHADKHHAVPANFSVIHSCCEPPFPPRPKGALLG